MNGLFLVGAFTHKMHFFVGGCSFQRSIAGENLSLQGYVCEATCHSDHDNVSLCDNSVSMVGVFSFRADFLPEMTHL